MADDDPTGAGLPGSEVGWPYRPAQPDRGSSATPPWAQPAPPTDHSSAPPPLLKPPEPPVGVAARPDRRRLGVVAAAAVLLVGTVAAIVLVTRGGDEGARPDSGGAPSRAGRAPAPSRAGRPPAPSPGVSSPAAGRPGAELTLLGGRVVVAARPGWEALESSDDNASVRLPLTTSTGREVLATLTIVTLSGPSAFDSALRVDGGTSFELTGTDGPFRVTVQPGLAARIAAGAARPKGAFFLNLSIFALDGGPLDAATLRTLFTDEVAPALSFP